MPLATSLKNFPRSNFTKSLRLYSERFSFILTCGNYNIIIRMMPPLTIEDAVLDEGLEIIEQVLVAVMQAQH